MASKEKKHFIKNMLIMICSMLVIRVVGMAFNIYYTTIIGATDTGMYHLLFSAYGFFITFSVAGCGIAATRLVSESAGCVNEARGAVRKCLCVCVPTSLIATAFAFLMRNSHLFDVLNEGTASVAVTILALSLVPTAIQSVLRGYFMAIRNVTVVTVSQLIEEFSQIIITLMLVSKLKGTPYAYMSMLAGVTIGAYISCAFDFCAYRKYISPDYIYCESLVKCKNVISIAFPIALGSMLRSFLVLTENMLIPQTLAKAGITDAIGEYGVIKGMSIPLMMFPSVITVSLSSLVVAEFSERKALRKVNGIRYIANKGCIYTMYYGFMVFGAILLWHQKIADLFYDDMRVGVYLGALSLLVIPMYLDNVVDGMLKGLNQQMSSLKYNISDSILRVALVVCLIPLMGSMGYIGMLYISELFNLYLSFNRLSKVAGIKFGMSYILNPVICTGMALLVAKTFDFSFLLSFVGYISVYVVCMLLLGKSDGKSAK